MFTSVSNVILTHPAWLAASPPCPRTCRARRGCCRRGPPPPPSRGGRPGRLGRAADSGDLKDQQLTSRSKPINSWVGTNRFLNVHGKDGNDCKMARTIYNAARTPCWCWLQSEVCNNEDDDSGGLINYLHGTPSICRTGLGPEISQTSLDTRTWKLWPSSEARARPGGWRLLEATCH